MTTKEKEVLINGLSATAECPKGIPGTLGMIERVQKRIDELILIETKGVATIADIIAFRTKLQSTLLVAANLHNQLIEQMPIVDTINIPVSADVTGIVSGQVTGAIGIDLDVFIPDVVFIP